MASQDYTARIWAGDPTVVAEARMNYYADSATNLVPFASVLYSFRGKRNFAEELLRLQGHLLRQARAILRRLTTPGGSGASLKEMDVSDTLATILVWMSRRKEVSDESRREMHRVARGLCEQAIFSYSTAPGGHTICLLQLTLAMLCLEEMDLERAEVCLEYVEEHFVHIVDGNQRARVIRKLGLLYRQSGHLLHGLFWGIRACLVPGVPMAVRFKSMAALVGVDR